MKTSIFLIALTCKFVISTTSYQTDNLITTFLDGSSDWDGGDQKIFARVNSSAETLNFNDGTV